MNLYYFNVDGRGEALGWTAGVYATSTEEALRVMGEHIAADDQELKTFDRCREHDADSPHVHFLNAWNNGRALAPSDIHEITPL